MVVYCTSNKYYIIMIRFLLIFVLTVSTSSLLCMAQIFSSSSEIETQTEDPLLPCEPPWRQHGSKCFFTTSSEREGGALPIAKQTCKRMGGDLGKPSSHDEHIFIRRILMSYNDTWIGATDNERKNWLDGTPMLYTNFNEKDFTTAPASNAEQAEAAGLPPALCSSQCCGLTTNRDGKWSYSSCDTVLNFVCVKSNETVAEYRRSTAKKPKMVHHHEKENDNDQPPVPPVPDDTSSVAGEESIEESDEEVELDLESSESKLQSDGVGHPKGSSGSVHEQQVKPNTKPADKSSHASFSACSSVFVSVSTFFTMVRTWRYLY